MQSLETAENRNIPLITAFRKDFPNYLSYFSFNRGLERGYVIDSIAESLEMFPEAKPHKNVYIPYLNSMGILRRRIMDDKKIEVDEVRLGRLCEIYFDMIYGTTRSQADCASKLLPEIEEQLYKAD